MNQDNFKLLIIDVEDQSLYGDLINSEKISEVKFTQNEKKAMKLLDDEGFKAVILNLEATSTPGVDLLTAIKLIHPDLPIIIFADNVNVDLSVECMKIGALDFMQKNRQNVNNLVSSINSIVEFSDSFLQSEVEGFRKDVEYILLVKNGLSLKNKPAFSEIITNDSKMISLLGYCNAISKTGNTVLITGETGTGKELFAKAIHNCSGREGEFVACNVAGLDDQLFSDTLFGHVKGAYTGANSSRQGLIEKASGGTIFLDEIGDLSLNSQVKLLRLIQEKEFFQLGSDEVKSTNAQIVVATNCDLRSLALEKKFRKDLFYRLITHQIHLPPLRKRVGDIKPLLDNFISCFSDKYGFDNITYHESLVALLKNYRFPGNVREFRSLIENAVVNHSGKMLSSKLIKNYITSTDRELSINSDTKVELKYLFSQLETLPEIKEATTALVAEALRRCDNNQSQAARLLNITHQALSKRLKNKM